MDLAGATIKANVPINDNSKPMFFNNQGLIRSKIIEARQSPKNGSLTLLISVAIKVKENIMYALTAGGLKPIIRRKTVNNRITSISLKGFLIPRIINRNKMNAPKTLKCIPEIDRKCAIPSSENLSLL